MINVMHDLIVRIFEYLDITSKLELYLRVKYTERIISNAYLKNTDSFCWFARRRLLVLLVTSGFPGQIRILS